MPAIKVIHRKLGKERADGLAFTEHNEIHLDTRLKGKKYFEIAIHELLHIQFPDMSEEDVLKHSKKLTNELWKLGFRKVETK